MKSLIRRWDSICQRCGLCCHEKHYTSLWSKRPPDCAPSASKRFFVDLTDPCPFLGEDNGCTIYPQRFKIYPYCKRLTPFHALFCGYLPADCAYVQRLRFWRPLLKKLRKGWQKRKKLPPTG